MRIKTLVLVFILMVLTLSNLRAQNLQPDSLLYSRAAAQAIDYFNNVIANESEIYNGAVYEFYPPANKGSFYFQDKNYCIPGLIRYNSNWYKNIPILYDIYNDIMVSTLNNNLFILNTEKISDVYLLNHHFTYINNQSQDNLTPGFYDVIYNGKSQVLIKRIKFINDHVVRSQVLETFYEDQSNTYIKKGDKYYQVDSKHSFLETFKDKKKDLNRYMNDNKIDYKKDKEGAVAKLAAYYDSINN
jgi:hypothetical protein